MARRSEWRPDLYVVARFLDALVTPAGTTGLTQARLQRAVQLNYDLFRKYLDALESRGLIVRTTDARARVEFRLSQKGLEAREHLLEWLFKIFGAPSKIP